MAPSTTILLPLFVAAIGLIDTSYGEPYQLPPIWRESNPPRPYPTETGYVEPGSGGTPKAVSHTTETGLIGFRPEPSNTPSAIQSDIPWIEPVGTGTPKAYTTATGRVELGNMPTFPLIVPKPSSYPTSYPNSYPTGKKEPPHYGGKGPDGFVHHKAPKYGGKPLIVHKPVKNPVGTSDKGHHVLPSKTLIVHKPTEYPVGTSDKGHHVHHSKTLIVHEPTKYPVGTSDKGHHVHPRPTGYKLGKGHPPHYAGGVHRAHMMHKAHMVEEGEKGGRKHEGEKDHGGDKGDQGEKGHEGEKDHGGDKGDQGEKGHEGHDGQKNGKGHNRHRCTTTSTIHPMCTDAPNNCRLGNDICLDKATTTTTLTKTLGCVRTKTQFATGTCTSECPTCGATATEIELWPLKTPATGSIPTIRDPLEPPGGGIPTLLPPVFPPGPTGPPGPPFGTGGPSRFPPVLPPGLPHDPVGPTPYPNLPRFPPLGPGESPRIPIPEITRAA